MVKRRKNLLAVVDTALQGAPAGSQDAEALVKSGVAAVSDAFDSVHNAAKQAAEAAATRISSSKPSQRGNERPESTWSSRAYRGPAGAVGTRPASRLPETTSCYISKPKDADALIREEQIGLTTLGRPLLADPH
jgi:2,4-dienoyl-CoA reductase-like NADH-dependent reductase (Old Yellow Enzyme family)